MISGAGDSSMKPNPGPHRRRRRRRRAGHFLAGNPYEQTSAFPGFFVLPRQAREETSAELNSPFKRVTTGLKEFGAVLLALAVFILPFFYFFWRVVPNWSEPEYPVGPPFVFDSKALKTNFDKGDLGRR